MDHWVPSLGGLPRRRAGGEEPFVGDKLKEEVGEAVPLSLGPDWIRKRAWRRLARWCRVLLVRGTRGD